MAVVPHSAEPAVPARVVGRDADRATATLCAISSKPAAMATVSRATVDDLLWAVRQINERNALIGDALKHNEAAALSEQDVRSLEEAYDAIHKVYEWINGASASQILDEGDAKKIRSLSTVAREHNVTIRALRHLNPDLDHLRNDDLLQPDQRVRVPGGGETATRGAAVKSGEKRRKKTRKVVQYDAVRVDTRRDPASATLATIARERGVTVRELRRANTNGQVAEFADDDPLPQGTRVTVPVTTEASDGPSTDNDSEGLQQPQQDKSRSRREVLLERGQYKAQQGDTLRRVADEVFHITLPRLRVANPELNRVGDYWVLAPGTLVYKEPPLYVYDDDDEDADDWSYSRRVERRRPSQDSEGSVTSEDDGRNHQSEFGFTLTQVGDTIGTIARDLHVRSHMLVQWNPELRQFSKREPLPKGMRLRVKETLAM